MASKFNIEIVGLDKLTAKLSKFPTTIAKEIDGEFEDSFRRINREQIRNAPVDEGGLKQAIGFKKNGPMDYEMFGNKTYMPFIEFGTKRRVKVPAELASYAAQFKQSGPKIGFEEFLKIITAWVRRKGISGSYSTKSRRRVGGKDKQAQEDAEVAFPIALSILRHGIKPHPFFFEPYFNERKALIERVKKVISNI